MTVKGYFDGECGKCNAKIAWCGTVENRPPCPKCGWMPSDESLAVERNAVREFELHLTKDAHFETGVSLRAARKYCGIPLKHAAEVLDLTPEVLARIEQDIDPMTPELADKMNELYKIGGK